MQSRMELQAEAGLFGLSSGEGPGLRRNGAATRPKAGSIGKHEADQGTLLGLGKRPDRRQKIDLRLTNGRAIGARRPRMR